MSGRCFSLGSGDRSSSSCCKQAFTPTRAGLRLGRVLSVIGIFSNYDSRIADGVRELNQEVSTLDQLID
jgi:hypothetical protein